MANGKNPVKFTPEFLYEIGRRSYGNETYAAATIITSRRIAFSRQNFQGLLKSSKNIQLKIAFEKGAIESFRILGEKSQGNWGRVIELVTKDFENFPISTSFLSNLKKTY
ncbi:MAG: hypothetical protein ABID38_06500 [Candidatus Diapherotrites archaeon]